MAAVRSPARGLSSEDLAAIRDSLAAGRRPKVLFTEAAGQVAGQSGQVMALTDPELSEEWVVVRFGRDELPFSPADLAMPGRGQAARRAGPAGLPVSGPRQATASAPQADPGTGDAAPAAGPVQMAAPPRHRGQRQKQEEKVPEPTSSTVDTVGAAAAETAAADGKAARRGPGRPARPKPPAALTVTLAYTEGEWTVAATQGTKALAKPYLIRPSEALKMVGLLDVPGVHEAVEQILAAERAGAEEQAQRLRAELAEVEARLAELRAVD
ncbi:MAG TPA: hypothetical protein VFM55_00490 [Micromonosporaceae bacterium]|nr:hypothetical protein [Micromonosporaceae bacterium]